MKDTTPTKAEALTLLRLIPGREMDIRGARWRRLSNWSWKSTPHGARHGAWWDAQKLEEIAKGKADT